MTQATAEALATDTAQPEPVAEMTEEQELASLFDSLESGEPSTPEEQAEEIEQEAEEQAAEAADEPEAEDEEDAEEVEAADEGEEAEETAEDEPEAAEVPSDLPRAVREAWSKIPAEAQEAILDRQREMARRLGEQGRMIQGIGPIRDSLVQAVQELPQLANMRPEQVAGEVFELAKMSASFQQNPVQTMMHLVDKHGLREPLKQVLTGEQPQQQSMRENQLVQKISQLERQLQQVSDPSYIQQNVQQYTTQAQLESSVNEFAQQAEHWQEVENHMPSAIQFVQSSAPNLPAKDVLERAYQLAVSQFVPEEKRASKPAAQKAAPASDPAKTKAAIKAKSVNVKGKVSDKTRSLTEEEELARVYDKMKD